MIIRSKHDKSHPYLSISMKLLRDRRLTSEERDCLIMMLSNVDDWEFSYKGLATQLGLKRETVKARVQSLIEKGYVSVSYPLGENGKPLPFAKGVWEIREEPLHSVRSLDTSERTHTCPVSGHQPLDTSRWTPATGHQALDTSERTQRNTEGIDRESPTKNQQIENQQSEEDEERENQVQSLSPYPFPDTEEFFSSESSSEATASPLQGKKPGQGEIISQADLHIEQAFNRFCEVYPNLGDRNLARAAFLAIPDISTICHQVANSVEWFKRSGKWDNWSTGQKNVSCPQAAKFLKRGDWQEYLKSGKTKSTKEAILAVLTEDY